MKSNIDKKVTWTFLSSALWLHTKRRVASIKSNTGIKSNMEFTFWKVTTKHSTLHPYAEQL